MAMSTDLELSSYVSERVTVGAWAVEPCPSNIDVDNRTLDPEFVVDFQYHDQNNGVSRNMKFKLKKEELMPSLNEEDPNEDVNLDVFDLPLSEWLDSLDVECDTAYRATWDVVLQGLEEMVGEVLRQGRKSLAMTVEIEVLPHDSDDEYEDGYMVVDDYEERMEDSGMEDSGMEEGEEGDNEKMVIEVLVSVGVKFVGVCSMTELDGSPCAICLEEFEESSKSCDPDQAVVEVSVLPCSHVLHKHCLLPWIIKGNSTCPLCRFDLDSAFDDQIGDGEEEPAC